MNKSNFTMASSKSPLVIIYGLLLMGAFVVSLYLHDYTDIHYVPANALLILAGIAGIIPAIRIGLSLPSALPAFMILGFWSFIALSLTWSTVPYDSTVTFIIFCALPLTFFGIILSPYRTEIVKTSTIFISFFLIIIAIWALCQHFITGSGYGSRAHYPLLNPNNLGALLNIALIPAFTFYIYTEKKAPKILLLGISGLFFAALLATESRGALCAFVITTVIIFIFSKPHITNAYKKAGALLFLLSVIFALFYINGASTLPAIPLPAASSVTDRLALWHTGLTMMKDHLWTGTGFGSFYLYYPSYRLPMMDNSLGYWAHMDPLQFGIEMGLIAPVLFYLTLLTILFRTIKSLQSLPAKSRLRPLIWAPFGALLALALHSHLTFNLYLMSILIMAGFALGAWYVFTHEALGSGFSTLQSRPRKILVILFIVLFPITINLMAMSAASGSWYVEQAITHKKGQNLEGYFRSLALAEKWAPNSFIKIETELAAYNLLILPRYNNVQARNRLINETEALLNEASFWNPAWSHIDHLHAMLNKEAGKNKKAEEFWLVSLQKMPHNFEANRALHEHYMSQGRVDDAVTILEKALQYPRPKGASVYYQTRLKEGKALLAIKRKYRANRIIEQEQEQEQEQK